MVRPVHILAVGGASAGGALGTGSGQDSGTPSTIATIRAMLQFGDLPASVSTGLRLGFDRRSERAYATAKPHERIVTFGGNKDERTKAVAARSFMAVPDQRGFTLIELMVAVAVVAILVSITNLRQVTGAARLAVRTLGWFALTSFVAVTIGIEDRDAATHGFRQKLDTRFRRGVAEDEAG